MNFKHTPRIFKDGGKGEKKASRKERKYQKRSDAFNSALQNIENLRASGASTSEIGAAQGNLGRLQNRLGADGLNRLREEQRTQAIARDAANTAAREAVNNSGITSHQSRPVIIQSPRQEVVLKEFEPSTFSQAFKQARKAGLKEFTWKGKRFHARTAEEDGKGKAKAVKTDADAVNNPTGNNTLTGEQQEGNTFIIPYIDKYGFPLTRPVTDRYGNIIQGPAAKSITNRQQQAIDISRLPGIYDEEVEPVKIGRTYIANRFIWPSGRDNTYIATRDRKNIFERDIYQGDTTYVDGRRKPLAESNFPLYKKIFDEVDKKIWKARGYQQGGAITKHQWGGIAKMAENAGNAINNFANFARSRQTTVTRDTIAPPNNYGIPMVLTQKTYPPNLFRKNIKQTTEFSRGSGDGDSYGRGHYPVSTTYTGYYNPNDSSLIKQNVGNPAQVNRMNERMRQAGRTTLSGGYYQQGGAIEDLRINDEMKLEALFRYFQAKGIPQEALIDSETGSFNADYEPDATKFFQTVGEDTAFWSAYKSAPDKTIAEYIATENPESVEMAKKGAKLKKLQKYKKGNPIKKCSCGCDMITSKEAGGKLVSKCACGCKN